MVFACVSFACRSPAARGPTLPAPPPKPSEETTLIAHEGCSLELPGSWRHLPPEGPSSFEQAEREDGGQTVSILGMPILKPSPAEQWREDLRYLAAELPKRHKNLFHTMTREQFEKQK
jgi:hypothetical protein